MGEQVVLNHHSQPATPNGQRQAQDGQYYHQYLMPDDKQSNISMTLPLRLSGQTFARISSDLSQAPPVPQNSVPVDASSKQDDARDVHVQTRKRTWADTETQVVDVERAAKKLNLGVPEREGELHIRDGRAEMAALHPLFTRSRSTRELCWCYRWSASPRTDRRHLSGRNESVTAVESEPFVVIALPARVQRYIHEMRLQLTTARATIDWDKILQVYDQVMANNTRLQQEMMDEHQQKALSSNSDRAKGRIFLSIEDGKLRGFERHDGEGQTTSQPD